MLRFSVSLGLVLVIFQGQISSNYSSRRRRQNSVENRDEYQLFGGKIKLFETEEKLFLTLKNLSPQPKESTSSTRRRVVFRSGGWVGGTSHMQGGKRF
jgi:hypothetical protein